MYLQILAHARVEEQVPSTRKCAYNSEAFNFTVTRSIATLSSGSQQPRMHRLTFLLVPSSGLRKN